MPAQAGDVSVDCFRSYLEIPGDLAVCHAADGFHEDQLIQVGEFLPVRCTECLATEGSLAMQTCKPLDSVRELISVEEA